jgi:catecholate siderophore receptor
MVKTSNSGIRSIRGRGLRAEGVMATLAFGACILPPARAPLAQEQQDPTILPTVVVEADRASYKADSSASVKFTQPLLDTPQTVVVIPEKVIKDQGVTTLRETLRNVPGITMQAGEGGVQGEMFNIRGFSARTDMFVDGVRDTAENNRDIFNTEAVEVVKGPSSSNSGRGSTGGSINQSTKKARAENFQAGTLSVGTANSKRATVDVNQSLAETGLEGAAIRINAVAEDSGVAGRDEIYTEKLGIAPTLSLGLGTPTRLMVSYTYLDQTGLPDYGMPAVGGSGHASESLRENYYGLKSIETEDTTTETVSAEVEHDFTDGLTLRNLTRLSRDTRFSVVAAPRGANAAADTMTRNNGNVAGRDRISEALVNQTDLTAHFNALTVQHDVVSGLELSYETLENQGFRYTGVPGTSLSNPDPFTPYAPVKEFTTFAESEVKGLGLYLFDTVTLNPQWEISGGVRWDHLDAETTSTTAAGVRSDGSRYDKMPSWKTGVVYKPLPNGSVYAAYGTSFNPSAETLAVGTTTGGTSTSKVAPEESRTYEFGSKWAFLGDALSVSGALFRTEKTNARTTDSSGAENITVLEGEQVVDGFEMGLQGNITDAWSIFSGYTYQIGNIEKSLVANEVGQALGNLPKHSASVWTTYELPMDFRIGAGAQYTGERKVSNTNGVRLDDYWLFDAMIGYKLTENIDVQVNFYNIFDEFYIEKVHSGGAHLVPGSGQAAVLSTSFKF